MFDHISLEDGELQQAASAAPDGQQAPREPPQRAELASGSANAALKLLDDLCLMASGARAVVMRRRDTMHCSLSSLIRMLIYSLLASDTAAV